MHSALADRQSWDGPLKLQAVSVTCLTATFACMEKPVRTQLMSIVLHKARDLKLCAQELCSSLCRVRHCHRPQESMRLISGHCNYEYTYRPQTGSSDHLLCTWREREWPPGATYAESPAAL